MIRGSCLCGGIAHEIIGLSLGTLDDDPLVRPKLHVFVGSKAPWYEISDDLPLYE
jgi:hypothetical protein